jgi:hypothetical protein
MSEVLSSPEDEKLESDIESFEKDFPMICLWCGKETGRRTSVEGSHGICEKCAKEIYPDFHFGEKK